MDFCDYGKIEKPLSCREIKVLKLIILGKYNIEIAKDLNIGVDTVKRDISNILRKLDVENRIQAAIRAIKEGLV